MRPLLAIVLVGAFGVATPLYAQSAAPPDGPGRVVANLEALAQDGTVEELARLASANVTEATLAEFARDFFVPGVTHVVASERDRVPLKGVNGDGYSLIVDFFAEVGARARIVSARVDVRRSSGDVPDAWEIVDLERLAIVEGLYQLRMDTSRAYAARDLTIDSEDLRLTLLEGSAFLVESDGGVTGMVVIGRGEMRFTPSSPTEKGQIRIFSGSDSLVTAFDGAFVRFSPSEYLDRVSTGALVPQTADRRVVQQAEEVFQRERQKTYSLDMSEVSRSQWFLLPPAGDFLSEVRTRRFGTLTYSKIGNQAEDITLFSRERARTMSIYSSAKRLEERGPSYNEDDLTDFDITEYELDADIDPDRETIEGRARITILSKQPLLSSLTLRLAEKLNVTSVTSVELGRLLFVRVRNQGSLIVSLPRLLPEGVPLTLLVSYNGHIAAQRMDSEGIQVGGGDEAPLVPSEPSFLLSNRAYWYPQNTTSDYTPARLRVTVPDGYRAVASGQTVTDELGLRDLIAARGKGRTLIFSATEPVRYLALVISRFVRVVDTSVNAGGGVAAQDDRAPTQHVLKLAVEANPRQTSRARQLAVTADDIMRFYGTLMNDTPYPSLTVAVVENELPGGHSPAYAVMLNTPPPTAPFVWRNDPAAFIDFPEFFIAHELAHQWWGQAVGWNNYHEQWLSEGFAQYFSALYAQKVRGDTAFTNMLRQFRRWALSQSDNGPVYLGYRLGHVRNDPRIFRALVYNKGAGVLHMLRRLIGDQAFFDGLRRFYSDFKFQKAGTADLQRALEQESGRPLGRFFERWIYGSDIPRIRYATSIGQGEVVVRFEQDPALVFDVPVTVTITYADGRVSDVMLPISAAHEEQRIKTAGVVRSVNVNRDSAALANFAGL